MKERNTYSHKRRKKQKRHRKSITCMTIRYINEKIIKRSNSCERGERIVHQWLKMSVLCFLMCLSGCTHESNLPVNEQSTHHEFGEAVHEKSYDQNAVIHITYPRTHMEPLDEAIQAVITATQKQFAQKRQDIQGAERFELNIDYQSYVKDDRYISIKLDIFMYTAQSEEQIVTIVYDSKKERMVQLQDLLEEDGIERIAELTREYFEQRYPAECNTQNFMVFSAPSVHNFEQFVLRKDAIIFYFQEGTLFDHSDSLVLSYDELADVMDLRVQEHTAFVPYQDILNEPTKQIDPNQPMVALTFDDGPTPRYTTAILDCLKEHQASATFFVLGSRADDYPEILQRMVLEGNEIGNHTFSHKQLTTLSKERIEEEISATQESIHNVTNQYPKIIRPPYGSKNNAVIQCSQGKKLVTWTIDTQDWRYRDAQKIVNEVVKQVKDGDIILMHDLYATTAEAAIILIPQLQEMGYQLVTVSELDAYGRHHEGKIVN